MLNIPVPELLHYFVLILVVATTAACISLHSDLVTSTLTVEGLQSCLPQFCVADPVRVPLTVISVPFLCVRYVLVDWA